MAVDADGRAVSRESRLAALGARLWRAARMLLGIDAS